MKKRIGIWDVYLDWRTIPPLFIVFTLALNILANAIYGELVAEPKLTAGLMTRNQFVLLAVGALIVALVAGYLIVVWLIRRVLRPPRSWPGTATNEAFKKLRKGIIYTVGGQTNTLTYSLESQQPQYVGMLCSSDTQESAEKFAESRGYTTDTQKIRTADPKSVRAFHDETRSLLNWMLVDLKLQPKEIVVDLTGGLRPMSIGAFLAAEEMGIDTQYVTSKYDEKNVPIPHTQDEILLTRSD